MAKKILFFLVTVLIFSTFSPVFAEISYLNLDNEMYFPGDLIYINGMVTDESSGLVTIVIRDPNNNFVSLNQAPIQSDGTFEKSIQIDSKFQISGIYNSTAFVLNISEAKSEFFQVMVEPSLKDSLETINDLESPNQKIETNEYTDEPKMEEIKTGIKDLTYQDTNPFVTQKPIADFVDPSKKPTYYLDRYYNEPAYKSWFDRNYPDLTIEEAIGYTGPKNIETNTNFENEIIPKAEAVSLNSSPKEKNSDVALSALTVGGLGILFAAVYGIKKKSESNSKFDFTNLKRIKQKFSYSLKRQNTSKILQNRLAKGEITIEEYERINEKLNGFS